MVGDIPPRHGRHFAPLFRAAMAAVPEAIEAIRVLATVGHKAGVEDEGLRMVWSGGTTAVRAALLHDTQSQEVSCHRAKVLS